MAYGNGGSILGGVGKMAPGDMMHVPKGIEARFDGSMPPPPRTPQTQMEAERLTKATEVLHLMLNELEARLADVMVPEGPANSAQDSRPQSPVALARHLGQLADRVEHATIRIKSLMDRIEV